MKELLPSLPGYIRGIVGHDDKGWTIQCSGCGETYTAKWLVVAAQFALFCRPHPEVGRLCKPCAKRHYAETQCYSTRERFQ